MSTLKRFDTVVYALRKTVLIERRQYCRKYLPMTPTRTGSVFRRQRRRTTFPAASRLDLLPIQPGESEIQLNKTIVPWSQVFSLVHAFCHALVRKRGGFFIRNSLIKQNLI